MSFLSPSDSHFFGFPFKSLYSFHFNLNITFHLDLLIKLNFSSFYFCWDLDLDYENAQFLIYAFHLDFHHMVI